MKNTDRMSWKDGWHAFGDMGYYVENGKLMRGMMDGRTVYPYLPVSKRYGGGWDDTSGIVANRRNFDRVSWF